jgi:hypothetical protein
LAYLRISEARAAGQVARSYVSKTASQILTEDSRRFSSINRYDVFLSHAYQNADTIHGVRSIIESLVSLSMWTGSMTPGWIAARSLPQLPKSCGRG